MQASANLTEQIFVRFRQAGAFDRAEFVEPLQYRVYLRVGPRVFDNRLYFRALTLADVAVEEGARRKGVFTGLVKGIESAAKLIACDAVFVENISSPIVHYVLSGRNYRSHRDGGSFNMLREVGL